MGMDSFKAVMKVGAIRRKERVRRILVVDDEKNYRIILENLLRKSGYLVLTADGAQSGLNILRKEIVDLVISDLRLPGMDGIGMCRLIQAEFGRLPCILFSAYLSPGTLQKMNETGIVGCLSKPFDNRDLLSLVERILHKGRMCAKPTKVLRDPNKGCVT
jgi:two-component system NtrC family response regulator